jgi:hypothetical protein
MNICLAQLGDVSESDTAGVPTLARMTIRILLRVLHHGLALPDLDGLAPLLTRASPKFPL